MMSKTISKTIMFTLLVLSLCVVMWAGSPNEAQYSAPTQPSDLESIKAELSRYRTWTQVNPQPVLMDPIVAAACAPPNISAHNPHSNKYVSVYVNDVGRPAMLSEKYPKFPPGSIIVKEKLSDARSGLPELLTIMVKRDEAFDPGNGNWEYLVMDGGGSRVERPTNVESCRTCHLANKATDYVSRIYLPKDVREELK